MRARLALTAVAACLLNAPASAADPPLFGREVVPVFYKLGCSAGECHGSFSGKGGFRLSLFAGDPTADFREVNGGLGRRVNRQNPDESLLLLKPTGRVPHGGGVRLTPGSDDYRVIRDWLAAGAKFDPAAEGTVASVRVVPPTLVSRVGAEPIPLRVVATLADGTEKDVTRFTRFEPFDPTIATADPTGRVIGRRPGDTHVLAHYAGQIGYTIALVPGERPAGLEFPTESPADALDRMILAKLKALEVVPSGVCTDAEFLRRVTLDTTGQLPTPEEVRKFLADTSPDKRAKKIDDLLAHPLHAAVWATKLCDITGVDNRVMYDRVSCDFHDWYRNKLERNLPWDQIVRRVLTATAADGRSLESLAAEQERIQAARKAGKPVEEPLPEGTLPWRGGYAARDTLDVFFANNKFRVQAGPDKGKIDPQLISLHAATAFLGVRLECAECHKHPHDRWTQADFRGFTAAFSYIDRGVDPVLRAKKVTVVGIHVADKPVLTYPDPATGLPAGPRVLGGPDIPLEPGTDPRAEVWKWMTSANNPYFARAMVNRVWAHYLGRGLIDPVDALSAGSPPSHPDVLDELVRDFVAHKYDLRHLHRRVLNTLAYQRGWETNATNAKDERNLSRRVLRRLTAEQALDAVAQATGTPVELAWVYGLGGKGGDAGRKIERAVECPLSRPGGGDSYLLKVFDKPQRTQACDCERAETPTLSQALYFYNDASLVAKVADKNGRLARLLRDVPDDNKLLDELYLATLSRFPTAAERERSAAHVKGAKSRAEGFEDVFWSLLNRQEFVVNH